MGKNSSTTTNKACNICGKNDFSQISDKDRHGKLLRTVICESCGLVAHAHIPTEEDISTYYTHAYRQDYHGESRPSSRRIMRAWNNGLRLHSLLNSHIESGSKVLEIGSGIGCSVKVFSEHGYQASGIEPNQDFSRYGKQVLHADISCSNLFDQQQNENLDLVLLVHVIEHFTSPTTALEHIHGMVRDQGLLYLECPNIAAPFATFGRLFHFAHIYNFSPTTLISLAEKCGFMLEKRLSADDDPDICLLFRRSNNRWLRTDADHAAKIKKTISSCNVLSYHLRADYLRRRIHKLRNYLREFKEANAFVSKLEARFANNSTKKSQD
ncbi:MAG: class I SAM-dependent methyltransferase [Mariprofundales bacterium]